jgi:ABC-2 type transporter
MLMNAGKIVFHGTVQETKDFFTKLNMICPPQFNPAEFYINIISEGRKSLQIMKFANKERVGFELVKRDIFEVEEENNSRYCNSVSWLRQCFLLSYREILDFFRDPYNYFIQLLILVVRVIPKFNLFNYLM